MSALSRRRTAVAAFSAATLLGLAALTGVASARNPSPWKITVVNSTGQDPANVYVALPSSGSPPTAPSVLPTGFAMDTAYALDPIGTSTPWVSEGNNRYSIALQGAWNSGTVLYSIGQPYAAKPARAPKVTIPSGGIMSLSVHGLPKKAEASIDIQVNGQWKYLGRVRSNPRGYAVLPRYAQTTRGQSTLIRARIGKKGVRYLRTIAGPPRDWGGQALSTVVTKYPLGTCPVHYATAKKPVAPTVKKAPVASVPLGGITVVRVRGLKRNESSGVDVKIGSGWRFVGRVKAARNGLLAMPPVAVNQRGQVVQVRLRGDGATRYVKLRAS
ncbi:MAG: hypothetical protein ACO3PB_02460 [Miltoncostaeaceae bacterium]